MNKFHKLAILITIVIIVVIVLLLLILNLKVNTENKNLIVEDDLGNEPTEKVLEENDNGFVKVDDANMFFTVLNTFNNYIDVLKYEINENDTIDDNPYQIKTEDDRRKILFSMLDEEYKNDNDIKTEDDIIEEKISSSATVIPIEIKVKYSTNIQTYALNIYIEDIDSKKLNEKFYIVKINNNNSTFSIKPLNNCESIDEIYENGEISNIEANSYNKYFIETMSDEAIVKIYMQNYKYMITNYPQEVFDRYMEDDYKEKRFGNYQNFKKYVENNINEISSLKAMRYTKQYEDDYTEVVIMDQYDNMYIFKENSIMNYTLRLDTYTITPDVFIEEYSKASEEERVQMNIDKFIQMINRHDYDTSYNCISEGFKNNYFSNQEQFENYIKNTFYTYNKFEFKSIEKKGSNLYVSTVRLTDLIGESEETRDINIIMQLNDNLDFEMSFSI